MRQRVKQTKYLTLLVLPGLFVSLAKADDSAYKEAMEYFKHRQVASQTSKPHTSTKLEKFIKKKQKRQQTTKNNFSLGFNLASPNSDNEDSFGGHITYISKSHRLLRQSVSLEYETRGELEKFSLFHSLYYDRYKKWGPEFAFGAGRDFEDTQDQSFIALKLGISLTDRFGGLLDLRLFYKQEVYFKKSLQSESVGASLYFKL